MPPTDKAQVFGPLAQLVEQLAFNQLVAGSNPARPTISLFLYQVLSALPRSTPVSLLY